MYSDADVRKSYEDWVAAGKPSLPSWSRQSGVPIATLKRWSANKWPGTRIDQGPRKNMTVAQAKGAARPKGHVLPEVQFDVPPGPLPCGDVKDIVGAGAVQAALTLVELAAGRRGASASVQNQASAKLLELAGHVPPRRADRIEDKKEDGRARVRAAAAGLSPEQLQAIKDALTAK